MKSILQTRLNRKEKCIKISKIMKSPSPDELTPIVMLQSSLYELAPIVISQSSLYEFTPIVMSQPLLYELTPIVMSLLWPFGCYFFLVFCFVLLETRNYFEAHIDLKFSFFCPTSQVLGLQVFNTMPTLECSQFPVT